MLMGWSTFVHIHKYLCIYLQFFRNCICMYISYIVCANYIFKHICLRLVLHILHSSTYVAYCVFTLASWKPQHLLMPGKQMI